ncbi:MAG TPA: hypothetical protein VFA51_14095, partial [Candidatus Udaeobacter sp.]|nr:hypothetical protein [Candidatus Udaeobacter sp.]
MKSEPHGIACRTMLRTGITPMPLVLRCATDTLAYCQLAAGGVLHTSPRFSAYRGARINITAIFMTIILA